MMLPAYQLVLPSEPKINFFLCTFHRITSMNDIFTEVDSEVASDGARFRGVWVGRADHLSTALDDVVPFPNHGDYWSRAGKSDQGSKEGAFLVFSIVLLESSLPWLGHVKPHKLVSLAFESRYDLSYHASLDAIWLDHNERAFTLLDSTVYHYYFIKELIHIEF